MNAARLLLLAPWWRVRRFRFLAIVTTRVVSGIFRQSFVRTDGNDTKTKTTSTTVLPPTSTVLQFRKERSLPPLS
jgi:hypothetical protein